jgi:ubiquinone/menaquinone biosynthesis C-methylase UbiE
MLPATLRPAAMKDLAAAYARWRRSAVGRIAEQVERDLVFDLAGSLAGRRVLDVGTGDGAYAIEAAARGASAVAADIDPVALAGARRRAADRGVAIELVEAPFEALPRPSGAFDVVLAITVLCFVEDPRAAFREAARVLAPGGRLVVGELARWSTWAAGRRIRGWLGNPTWRRAHFWSRRELAGHARAAGLRVTGVRGAVHFPRSSVLAHAIGPIDGLLGWLHVPGAAFIALAAQR